MSTQGPIQWRALYGDGTYLDQFEGDRENSYFDIDRSKLIGFGLRKDGRFIHVVHLELGQRLIYRRRVFMRDDTPDPIVFYLVGWQQTVADVNVQSIAVIHESTGETHMIGRWTENHPVFGAVEFFASEEQ